MNEIYLIIISLFYTETILQCQTFKAKQNENQEKGNISSKELVNPFVNP